MNEPAKSMLTTCIFSLRPPRNSSFLTNFHQMSPCLSLRPSKMRRRVSRSTNRVMYLCPLRLDVSSTPIRRTADRSIAARDLLTQWRKMRQIRGAVSFTVFDTAATGISPSTSIIIYASKSSVNPLLERAPRNFYHFVFAIGHYNARHTAMKIALMLEKVEVVSRLVFRVIGLLILAGVIDKLSAFPKIDINMERLAFVQFLHKLHFANLPRRSKA